MRGSAHIGVLKALFEKQVQAMGISATSAGAFIGAFICDGFQPDDVAGIIQKHEPELHLNIRNWKRGFMDFSGVKEVLKKNLRHQNIQQLQIPLYISATSLDSGLQKIFTEGSIIDAVAAASAIPMILPPVEIDGRMYIDGGVSNNLPYEPFIGSLHQLIGIHVNPLPRYDKNTGWLQNLERTLHLMMLEKVMHGREYCDLFIEPPTLTQFLMFESGHSKEMIEAAYQYTLTDKHVEDFIQV